MSSAYEQLKHLLGMAVSPDAGQCQNEIAAAFDYFTKMAKSEECLVMAVQDSKMSVGMRAMAGWLLKTQVRRMGLLLEAQRDDLLQTYLSEPDRNVRNALGSVLALVYVQSVKDLTTEWKGLLGALLQTDRPLLALSVLEMICQDYPDGLVGNELFDELLRFLMVCLKQGEEAAALGLSCLNQFIIFPSDALEERLPEILESLSLLASSSNLSLQKRVLECLSSLTISYPYEMMQVMPSVMDFMLRILETHGDPLDYSRFEENLALDACDFWMTLVEQDSLLYEGYAEQITELVRGYLPRLLPALLKAMTYAEDDLELQDNCEGNVMQPDEVSSLLPRHYRNKSTKGDDAEDEEEELDEFGSSGWSLRKCAGSTLDRMAACVFGDSEHIVQQLLIPLINEKFAASNRDWRLLESGFMAIGAIAEGAGSMLTAQMVEELVEFLCIREGRLPLVRATAAWTLTRLPLRKNGVRRAITFLSQGILQETSKRVQRVSIVFLQSLLGKHPNAWKARDVIQLVLEAALLCQLRNRLQLCDLVAFVADECGLDDVEDALYVRVLHFLIELWSSVPRELVYAVVEAVSAVSTASGERVPREAAHLIYHKCATELGACCLNSLSDSHDNTEEEYTVAMLDVITGLLPTGVVNIGEFEEAVVRPLSQQDSSAAILQSVFGFVGDSLKLGCSLKYAQDYFSCMQTVAFLIEGEMDEDGSWTATRNNALWALGEAAHRGHLTPEANLIRGLVSILEQREATSSGILDNAAVTLGRCLGRQSTLKAMVPEGIYVYARTRVMALPDGDEKISSLHGLQ